MINTLRQDKFSIIQEEESKNEGGSMVSKSMSVHQSVQGKTNKKMSNNEVDFLKNKVKELEASLIQAN
jgi:hypothetical protein